MIPVRFTVHPGHNRACGLLWVAALALVLLSCGEGTQSQRGMGESAPATPAGDASQGTGGEESTSSDATLLDVRDEDFVEGEKNRDPFRGFARLFEVRPVDRPQVEAILPTTSIDEMRLTAIVSGVASPRAMFVDGTGVGYVVRRGDFLGRPEVVQSGGPDSVAVPLHWKVERIRDNAVVLSREDTGGTDRPPVTRVLQLHED